jgi:ribosomal protein L17
MYSNMLLGLVEHGRIQTTERRARVLRSEQAAQATTVHS